MGWSWPYGSIFDGSGKGVTVFDKTGKPIQVSRVMVTDAAAGRAKERPETGRRRAKR